MNRLNLSLHIHEDVHDEEGNVPKTASAMLEEREAQAAVKAHCQKKTQLELREDHAVFYLIFEILERNLLD